MRSFWSTHTAAREEKSKPRTSAEPYKFVLDLDEASTSQKEVKGFLILLGDICLRMAGTFVLKI